jgi:hypothetical protein
MAKQVKKRVRKRRAKDLLAEPFCVDDMAFSKGKPIYLIWGYNANRKRVQRQSPRDGSPAAFRVAHRIRQDLEMERAQRLGSGPCRAMRETRLTAEQLEEAEAAYTLLETRKRSGFLNHIQYAADNMPDGQQTLLSKVIERFLEDRQRQCDETTIVEARVVACRKVCGEINSLFPGLSIAAFATEEVTPVTWRAPKVTRGMYAALLGLTTSRFLALNELHAAPPLNVTYYDGTWIWDEQCIPAIEAWAMQLEAQGCKVAIPVPLPPTPFPAPPPLPSFPRHRVQQLADQPNLIKHNGRPAGSAPSRKTRQDRRDVAMQLLRFAKRTKYIKEIPDVPTYLKHNDRERGLAAYLTPAQLKAHLDWYEDNRPEYVFWEALKGFCGIRPDGELLRLDAWINSNTPKAIPSRFVTSSEAITIWPEVKSVQIVKGVAIDVCGVISVAPSVSKIRKPRFTHVLPNVALYIALYGPLCKRGTWSTAAIEDSCENFRHLADRHYSIDVIGTEERRRIDPSVTLSHDILRHTTISNFVAVTGSQPAAAIEFGTSTAIIDRHYLNVVSSEVALLAMSILPKGWEWGPDRKSFVPPADWIKPIGWVLPLSPRIRAAA